MFCDTVVVCTPYASLRGSEPIVGMDGSRWKWVIGSASFGRERFIGLYSRGRSGRFGVCTTSSFDLTVLCYLTAVMMLSKDFLGGTGTILLLLFLLFLLLETDCLQKTRGVESLLACILFSSVGIVWGLSIWLEAWIEGFAYLQYLPSSTRKKKATLTTTPPLSLSINPPIPPNLPPSSFSPKSLF